MSYNHHDQDYAFWKSRTPNLRVPYDPPSQVWQEYLSIPSSSRLMHRLPSNSPSAASWQVYTHYPTLGDTRPQQIPLESSTRLQKAISSQLPPHQPQQYPDQNESRTITPHAPFTPPPEYAMPGSYYPETSTCPKSKPTLSEVCNRNKINTPRRRGYPFTPSPTPPASGTIWPPSISPM
jgi:hypothetical protein